jgi:hypothetical protein
MCETSSQSDLNQKLINQLNAARDNILSFYNLLSVFGTIVIGTSVILLGAYSETDKYIFLYIACGALTILLFEYQVFGRAINTMLVTSIILERDLGLSSRSVSYSATKSFRGVDYYNKIIQKIDESVSITREVDNQGINEIS